MSGMYVGGVELRVVEQPKLLVAEVHRAKGGAGLGVAPCHADPLVRGAVVGAVCKPVAEPVTLAHQPACIRLGIEAVGRREDVEPEAPLKRHLKLVGLQMHRCG